MYVHFYGLYQAAHLFFTDLKRIFERRFRLFTLGVVYVVNAWFSAILLFVTSREKRRFRAGFYTSIKSRFLLFAIFIIIAKTENKVNRIDALVSALYCPILKEKSKCYKRRLAAKTDVL